MRSSRISDERIVQAQRQAEAGTPVVEIWLNVTETTFFRWKKRFTGLDVSELRELKQVREENRKLKQAVAELTLDKQILREALGTIALIIAGAALFPRNPSYCWYESWFGRTGGEFWLSMSVGTPIAYVVEAVAGLPGHWWLHRTGRLRSAWVGMLATVAGAITVGSFEIAFDGFGHSANLARRLVTGACGGLAAGVTLWRLAYADPSVSGKR